MHAPGKLCMHDVIDSGKKDAITIKSIAVFEVLDDVEQVLIPDILDKSILNRTFTLDPIGTPGLKLSDNQMFCRYCHSPKIRKNSEIEKCERRRLNT